MSIATESGPLSVPLDAIHVPSNIRDLDAEHVDALAESIRLQGLIVPLVVTPPSAGDAAEVTYTLVAGFHRFAALRKLGVDEATVMVRNHDRRDGEAAARAIENIARKQLTPYEEARAVAAMLERGLTEEGAARALGWSRRSVTQRAKLLSLPDDVARGLGDGRIALADLETLLAIHARFPRIGALLGRYLLERANGSAMHDPTWTLSNALRAQDQVFAVRLGGFGLEDYVEAAGGPSRTKKAVREAIEEIAALQGQRGYGQRSAASSSSTTVRAPRASSPTATR